MTNQLRLMCILAHPDDESMGAGGTLAKYSSEGIETYLLCATRGERGWNGDPGEFPGVEAFGKIRTAELHDAAKVLGLRQVHFLDYIDGELDKADPDEIIARITCHVREIRPHVVVTFPPDGSYGHPDHIAISQFCTAALVCAADRDYLPAKSYPPHRVAKFYYQVDSRQLVDYTQSLLGGLSIQVDDVMRRHVAWEEWAITTRVDATAFWRQVWEAVKCHRTQVESMLPVLEAAPEDAHKAIWGIQNFYRVYSLVNGGRAVENDLFAGLR